VSAVAQKVLVPVRDMGSESSDKFKGRELLDMFLLVVSGGIAIGSLLVLSVIV